MKKLLNAQNLVVDGELKKIEKEVQAEITEAVKESEV